MILTMGAVVLVIVLAVMLPIMEINQMVVRAGLSPHSYPTPPFSRPCHLVLRIMTNASGRLLRSRRVRFIRSFLHWQFSETSARSKTCSTVIPWSPFCRRPA